MKKSYLELRIIRQMLLPISILLILLPLPSIGFLSSSTGTRSTTSTSLFQADRPYFVPGPPAETKPDYDNIHGPMGKAVDNVFLAMFRTKLAENIGVDSDKEMTDYGAIMDLTKALNARFSDRSEIHERAQKTLSELFPSWMPPSYAVLFSQPFPEFSSRMNAWATKVAGTWLMGDCEINDIVLDEETGTIGKNQGLLVKRCRFLEESQCASICVNSCKIPTQNFFLQEMGLPLTMTPDYDTFECQFAFGKAPDEKSEMLAKNTPCLSQCPSMGGLREWHNGDNEIKNKNNDNKPDDAIIPGETIPTTGSGQQQPCQLMGD